MEPRLHANNRGNIDVCVDIMLFTKEKKIFIKLKCQTVIK